MSLIIVSVKYSIFVGSDSVKLGSGFKGACGCIQASGLYSCCVSYHISECNVFTITIRIQSYHFVMAVAVTCHVHVYTHNIHMYLIMFIIIIHVKCSVFLFITVVFFLFSVFHYLTYEGAFNPDL